MSERLDKIVTSFKEGMFEVDEYQQWDKDLTMIMTEAAKKFETESSIWWSPKLHHAYLSVKF